MAGHPRRGDDPDLPARRAPAVRTGHGRLKGVSMNATMNGESLWPRLAELPLAIEACEYDRLHAVLTHEFERITTHVRLVGSGADGLGEDISIFREDGTALHETRPTLGL